MPNLLDNAQFNSVPQQNTQVPADFQQMAQYAMQNPRAFEEQLRQTNPQAYQQAMQLRNNFNPRDALAYIARARGINPNVLRMFGL